MNGTHPWNLIPLIVVSQCVACGEDEKPVLLTGLHWSAHGPT